MLSHRQCVFLSDGLRSRLRLSHSHAPIVSALILQSPAFPPNRRSYGCLDRVPTLSRSPDFRHSVPSQLATLAFSTEAHGGLPMTAIMLCAAPRQRKRVSAILALNRSLESGKWGPRRPPIPCLPRPLASPLFLSLTHMPSTATAACHRSYHEAVASRLAAIEKMSSHAPAAVDHQNY